MSKLFFDIGLSMDGFIAGDNRSPQNPLGDRGTDIHQWMFRQKAFWEHLGQNAGEEDTADGELIRNTVNRAGAYIMGKRMFEEGEANWPEDLFKAPVYVLTHEKREPWVQKGSTTFYFVNDGMESALEQARASANGRDIRIQGGGETIRQYLNAGLVDDFHIHIAPVFIGSGIRLFDDIDRKKVKIENTSVTHSPLATHIACRLK